MLSVLSTMTKPDVDLVITDANVPKIFIQGNTLSLSWIVQNQGTESTTNYIYSTVYYSSDAIFDSSDIELTYFNGSINKYLAANESYTLNIDIETSQIPDSKFTKYPSYTYPFTRLKYFSEGDGYLFFKVDDISNTQLESNENNNTFVVPFTVIKPDLDLVITDTIFPATIKQGESFEVSWQVQNQGKDAIKYESYFLPPYGPSGSSSIDSLYYSTDPYLDASDQLLNSGSGSSATIAKNRTYSLPTGRGYLLFIADHILQSIGSVASSVTDYYTETNEENNIYSAPVMVENKDIDLIITEVNIPAIVQLDQSIPISWTFKNQGTEDIESFSFEIGRPPSPSYRRQYYQYDVNTKIYFSTDNIYSQEDTLIGSFSPGDFFHYEPSTYYYAAGQTTTISKEILFSSAKFPPTSGYLLFEIDAGEAESIYFGGSQGNYTETNENNNFYAVPISIATTVVKPPVVFNPAQYGASYPDLIRGFGYDLNALTQHYNDFGYAEGRNTDNFNEERYLASYPDLITGYGYNLEGVTEHYIKYGFYEGRTTNKFKPEQYLASYPDLITGYGYNLEGVTEHYIKYGFYEGRTTNKFKPEQYLASYPDLITGYGYNLEGVTEHYIKYGFYEGRLQDNFSEAIYLASYGDLILNPVLII
jgi:hypothetical protein